MSNDYNSISAYCKVVEKTSAYQKVEKQGHLPKTWLILAYGLMGEIASVVTEVKKYLLDNVEASDVLSSGSSSILEELSDTLWYMTALTQYSGLDLGQDILASNVTSITKQNKGRPATAKKIAAAKKANKNFSDFFNEYQAVAAAARWEKNRSRFLHSAMTLLTDSANAILATKLGPETAQVAKSSAALAKDKEKEVKESLGNIAWYLSVIAENLNFLLSDIAAHSARKSLDRYEQREPTKLPDENAVLHERFPRRFELQFITTAKGKSRMYYNGKKLGDDLTDNYQENDGYRFHDALHLGQLAVLGWSPVFRSMMGLKRKSNPNTDEREDGARAKIVDELIVKLIHNEGVRLARNRGECSASAALFEKEKDISFDLLRTIKNQVNGLEVADNSYKEWVSAILNGYETFNALNKHRQGTVTVDLEKRNLSFDENVHIYIAGPVVGSSNIVKKVSEFRTNTMVKDYGIFRKQELEAIFSHKPIRARAAEQAAMKEAIVNLLRLPLHKTRLQEVEIVKSDEGLRKVHLFGEARKEAGKIGAVTFQVSVASDNNAAHATALAIGDPADIMPSPRDSKSAY